MIGFSSVAAAAPTTSPGDGTAARFVVGFGAVPAGLSRGASFHGGQVLTVDRGLDFAVVRAASPAVFARAASADAGVTYVEADPVQKLIQSTPNDPLFPKQYGPQEIGAPAAWDTTTGAGVTVCIVDTGVRATHEDLQAHYVGGVNLIAGTSNPADDNGHGTHVAGIAAATMGNGVGIAGVSQANLLAVKALDSQGRGAWSTVATGIQWCVDHGAKVVSLSLGGSSGSSALKSAVAYAWNHGALIVAAAGNDGPCSSCVLYPAAYSEVVAVGCVYSDATPCSFTAQGSQVELAAPGSMVLSTYYRNDADYVKMSGTSMSTPHVAGAAALLWAAHPGLTNQQVRDALDGNAQDLGAAGRDTVTGYGLVRPDLALAALGSGTAPAPAPTGQPDLAVTSFGASPASPVENDTVTLSATVANAGSADAGAFAVRFQLDGATLGDVSVPGLAAGASTTVSTTWTAQRGNHTATVLADATNAVAESDETNNAASLTLSVAAPTPASSPAPAPAAGVTLSASPSSSATAAGGSTATYTITVTNTGNLQDTFRLGYDSGKGGWTTSLSASSVTLAAGASIQVTLTVDVPTKGKPSLDTLVTATSGFDPSVSASLTVTTTRA